jgi:hypothetical protein
MIFIRLPATVAAEGESHYSVSISNIFIYRLYLTFSSNSFFCFCMRQILEVETQHTFSFMPESLYGRISTSGTLAFSFSKKLPGIMGRSIALG